MAQAPIDITEQNTGVVAAQEESYLEALARKIESEGGVICKHIIFFYWLYCCALLYLFNVAYKCILAIISILLR